MVNIEQEANASNQMTIPKNIFLDGAIEEAAQWLIAQQADDGHWAFELEADATIPAEYIFLNHFLGDINDEIEQKIAVYLRSIQETHGGWPLYHDGDFNMSASVKAYFALKLVGDDTNSPHMALARNTILDMVVPLKPMCSLGLR